MTSGKSGSSEMISTVGWSTIVLAVFLLDGGGLCSAGFVAVSVRIGLAPVGSLAGDFKFRRVRSSGCRLSARGGSLGLLGLRTSLLVLFQSMVDHVAKIHQHAQRLAGRILGVEHHLPRLADHAKASDRLFRRELRAAAVERGHAIRFQFSQA